jgi:HEAT repeat protein
VTALTYLCADEPQRLAPHLRDKRWYVVRNVVSILGQIGGSGVVEMLRMAAQHDELRVRREVVKALGSVSRLERQPVLIQMLKSDDAQLLSAALHMLTRERHPRVVKAILERVEARDLEELTEENQRAFLGALGDIAEDDDVPDLERLLMKDGGWFARRTLWRDAAARILHRLGTPRARTVLEAGLRSRTEAIRLTCQAATSGSKAA